jgi:hypothetical protein
MPELAPKNRDKVGNAEDYTWITGQLCRVHTAQGEVWVVRYAPIEQVDKYGGSMVLVPVVEMKNYREGDVVCVQGEVLKDQQAPGRLGGAPYRVTAISIINRNDPEESDWLFGKFSQ